MGEYIFRFPANTPELQRIADADHARQPRCSWCDQPGEPYEYKGVRYDGLTACQGDRLCKKCTDAYLDSTPLQVLDKRTADDPGVLYDLNPKTWEWSEQNILGCKGEPPVRAIAVEYRAEFMDYHAPKRGRRP